MENATTLERATAVRTLYQQTFGNLLDTALDNQASLTQVTAFKLVQGLLQHLSRYDGPANDPYAFLLWASGILSRGSAIVVIIENHRKVINAAYKAVRENPNYRHLLTGSADERDDFDFEVLKSVDKRLEALLSRGSASLSTRLYAIGRFAALTLKNRALVRQKYHIDVNLEALEAAQAETALIGGHRTAPLRDIPEPSQVTGTRAIPDPLENAYRDAGL
jgi:hypothetical protein